MNKSNPYAVVDDESAVAIVMRSMILTNKVMMDDAEAIIKSAINPLTRSYWKGRRDVYESQLRSCQILMNMDGLLERST